MSSISAGTSVGTALVSTGDTTGDLVLKTGSSATTAVTIAGSNQAVTLAQPLGVASGGTGLSSPGTAGNVLQSNGTSWVSTAFSAGFNGATETTSATNVTLTSSSTQVQYIAMTSENKFVVLPNATTLSTRGGPVFVVANSGLFPFAVINTSGETVAVVYPNTTAQIYLTNNSTSAGIWTTGQTAKASYLRDYSATYTSGFNIPLTLTSGVTIYYNGSVIAGRAYQASATGAITYGSEVTVLSSGTIYNWAGCGLNSTTGLFYNANGTTARAVAFTVSGTTLTVGTPVNTATTGSPQSQCVVRLSDTTAMLGVVLTGTSETRADFVTVSGTTITINSTATNTAFANYVNTGFKVRGSNVVIMHSGERLTSFVYSGTTITATNALVSIGFSSTFASVTSLNTNSIVASGTYQSNNAQLPFTVIMTVNATTGAITVTNTLSGVDALEPVMFLGTSGVCIGRTNRILYNMIQPVTNRIGALTPIGTLQVPVYRYPVYEGPNSLFSFENEYVGLSVVSL